MPDDVVAVRPLRPPQDNIPQTRQERDALLQVVAEYVERERPVSPLSIDELRIHAGAVLKAHKLDEKYLDYAAVLVSNEVWRPTVARIPYNRRLLLLPQCLRDSEECPAGFDEIGLVCEHCGRCAINEFKSQAERLGYAVLVAEGSPVVMSLIETGQVEAVVGVSCLSVLERVFPYMEAGAVPGVAIPLLRGGCADTAVDVDWVWDAIYQSNEEQTRRLNLDDLRNQVDRWFTCEALSEMLTNVESETEELATKWMAKVGKRWRPFLAACAYQALAKNRQDDPPDCVRRASIAVECFHKASLIHDDIEDGDELRYGDKSLHAEYGVPIALNVGDLLLGEGYRLLVETGVSDNQKTRMLAAAAQGHRNLCLGQGEELSWIRRPRCLMVAEVIDIFTNKTAPAFEVALKVGAILAGCGDELNSVLEEYSRSLGIAYQIRDDIEDFRASDQSAALNAARPSLMLALAYERAGRGEKNLLESVWDKSAGASPRIEDIKRALAELKVEKLASDLMESYKSRAIGCLYKLTNADLKGLLRRVIGKIFNDFEMMGCCNDRKAGHDYGGESSQASSG
ncbi:MAG: polyprenyl synthetase family protein [Sedimentisphaerales bacterium]|nr:polyprenyl synthetase family protein [Sedimentisphaerales bacterium]